MAYGLYLYKQLKDIRLEIHRNSWTGKSIEIKAMGATPIELIGVDNAGSDILTPIIKSSVNINIKDLGEVNYRELFTSNATKFKVIIRDKGVQVWGGYLTPDSYSQAYEYRTSISLIARDNLGMLDQLDYDWLLADFITPTQLITKAQERIGWVMNPIEWLGDRYISGTGVDVKDACINAALFEDKTWWEAIEMVLSSLGQQLRYVGNNRVVICNVADIYNLGNIGSTGNITHSIGSSAQMEIVPSWKQIDINQDYGVYEENKFSPIKNEDLQFVRREIGIYGGNLYKTIGKWKSQSTTLGSCLLIKSDEKLARGGGPFTETAMMWLSSFEGLNNSGNKPYIYYDIPVSAFDSLSIVIDVHNRLYACATPEADYLWKSPKSGDYEWWLDCDVRFIGNSKTYYLNAETWSPNKKIISFLTKFNVQSQGAGSESNFTINIISTPEEQGVLRFCLYPVRSSFDSEVESRGNVAKINNIYIKREDAIGGRDTKGNVNELGNVKESIDIVVGEVPSNAGDYLTYIGGLFDDTVYHSTLNYWSRPDYKGGVTPLAELIGRGYAHHFIAFKSETGETTGGEIVTANIPFNNTQDFAKRFNINGKEFIVNSATYNMMYRLANVTLRQVLPYTHSSGSYTVKAIDAGSGSVIGSGEKQVVTWSDAGGSGNIDKKRTYELGDLYEELFEDAVLLSDTRDSSTALKVPVKAFARKKHAPQHFKGGEDEIQPYDIEAARRAGDSEQDFNAKISRVLDLIASGEVGSSEFVSGLLGTGWNIDAKGNAEMNSLILRTFLQTPELIKNQVRVIGTQAWLTECGTTDIVVANPRFRLNVSDENGQRLVAQFADKWFVKFHEEGANGWFRKDDILRGIYNYDDGFETVYLRVEHSINGGYLISSINGLAPAKEMVLARQGNFTDPARQGSIYLDSAEGYIRVLGEVNSTEIALKNVKMQGGNLRGLRVWGVSDMPSDGLYAPGIVVAADQVAGLDAKFTVVNDKIEAQAKNINLKADKVTVDGLLNVNGDIRADKIDAKALAASSALIDNLIVKHLSSRPAKSGKGLDIDSSLRMYDGNGEETMKFQVLDDGMPKLGMYKGGASDDNGEIEIRHNEFRMLARTNNGQTTNYVFIDPFAGFELNGYKNNNGSLEFYRLILSKNGISSTPNMVMPGVIAKARVDGENVISKTWGKRILQVVPNSVGPGNKRVYHDIGHTDYTTICTAYKSDSHPQVWEEGANYVDIWSEGGFNIILTGNNNG